MANTSQADDCEDWQKRGRMAEGLKHESEVRTAPSQAATPAAQSPEEKVMALLGPACCDCMSLKRIKSLADAIHSAVGDEHVTAYHAGLRDGQRAGAEQTQVFVVAKVNEKLEEAAKQIEQQYLGTIHDEHSRAWEVAAKVANEIRSFKLPEPPSPEKEGT